ncbi:MAG: hypothetical protein ABIN58_06130 [candidate division WOR-3 bacterium]
MTLREKWRLGLCFFISGGTTLALEVAWSKELSYILGNSLYSIATVVAAFMGGLGIGSALASIYAKKVRSPIGAYAWIQCVIAGFGALSIPVFRATEPVFQVLYQSFEPGAGVFLFVRFLVVFALMLVPATLMGMTLPATFGLVGLGRPDLEVGRSVGEVCPVAVAATRTIAAAHSRTKSRNDPFIGWILQDVPEYRGSD